MFSFSSEAGLIISASIISLCGLFFYRNQNHSCAIGGKISKPKLMWLCLTIYIYFPLITILAFEKNVLTEFRIIFASLAVLMWLRAVGELYLLYGIKKWSPKIGIGHNIVCLMTIIGELIFKAPFFSGKYWNFYLVLGLISLCLVLDSFYAYQFRKIVHGKTKGADGLWFADEEQERFRRLNAITQNWNWIVMTILILFFWRNF